MHIERLTKLSSFLLTLPRNRFDMSVVAGRGGEDDITLFGIDLDQDCGTAGCIAGWAIALFAPDRRTSTWLAQQLLELTEAQERALFFPKHKQLSLITNEEAAYAITTLIHHGEPTWH